MQTLMGIIHGRTIQLDEAPRLADGATVRVSIDALEDTTPGTGFARTEGALVDDEEWDGIMEEVQATRRHERIGED